MAPRNQGKTREDCGTALANRGKPPMDRGEDLIDQGRPPGDHKKALWGPSEGS